MIKEEWLKNGYIHFHSYSYSQFYPTGERIRVWHFCDDVLSFLLAFVWRICHAFRFVGWEYGIDDCHQK